MSKEPQPASGMMRNPQNAISSSTRMANFSPTTRIGKESKRLFPDLEAQDIVDTYETFENGGSLTILAERTNKGLSSRSNWDVYKKEKEMSRILAEDGHNVVLRESSKAGETYDITIDGIAADLKWVTSPKFMKAHAEKATTKQGAAMTVFMIDGKWKRFRGMVHDLSSTGYHGLYIRKNTGVVYTY